jgi:DNA helicase-2/ATP-dependent DNA helicase PcrA
MTEVKKLNKEQLKAVNHKKGPLLIIAGAGTGKTTVITERIKHLILKGYAKPSEILALTFTEKASAEMETRIDEVMPYGYLQMWIMTFHSFCDRVLRSDALHIGLNPKYKLATETESIQLIKSNLFKFDLDYFVPLGNPNKFVASLREHFSRLQDEDITPNEYKKFAFNLQKKAKTEDEILEAKKTLELSSAFQKYEEIKLKENFLDFGDLIVKTLLLFRSRPNILRNYQNQFKYLLIDEFQDVNFAQNQLSILLAGKNKNITVVGDDDQSIYRFRGAAVSNIIQFRSFFPKTKIIVLNRNYRSSQEILDKAYTLIQNNNPDRLEIVEKVDKKLISTKKEKGEVSFIHKDRVENEADAVAKKITELISNSDINYSDIAILVRANNHAEPFIKALSRYGIPYQFLGPGKLFREDEIIDLISYLKVLYNIDDSLALYRVLAIDELDLSARDIAKTLVFAKKFNLSLFDACEKISDVSISDNSKEKIKNLIKLINKHLKQLKSKSAGEILYSFLVETNLLEKLLDPRNPYDEKKASNIAKLFDKLKTYEIEHDDSSVFSVVDWIDLSTEIGESPLAANIDWNKENAVNILTVHSSKGLEFKVVFLVNLASQRFPSQERKETIPIPEKLIKEILPKGDFHLEEERRLFYVGMTRAKDKLFLTAADFYGEGKREKKLSQFVFEALGEEVLSSKEEVQSQQLSFLDYEPKLNSAHLSAGVSKEAEAMPIHINYLSYSQIETFSVCPLHYKLKYILKVPTPPSSSQSFGNSFHLTMKAFYENLKKGELPSKSLIHNLLKENWISEGYISKSHETKSFEKAVKFLDYYLEDLFDPNIIPEALEQPFLIKLNSLKIGGKIDRVDVKGEEIEIVDYKTGANPLTQKEADKDLQLSIYALAAVSIPEYPFNRDIKNVKLSLYYFDKPQTVTTTRTKKDLEEAKKTIEDYKKQIESSDFKCSKNFLCENCEYKLFCREEK